MFNGIMNGLMNYPPGGKLYVRPFYSLKLNPKVLKIRASMKKILPFILPIALALSCAPRDENIIADLMEKHPEQFADILANKDRYEVQVIYTQIDRDEHNKPSFRSFYFNVDSSRYFYPASTVKLPLVLLSLGKLRHLNIEKLDKFSPVFHDSVYSGQQSAHSDTTAENQLPSIAHYAKKILVVSDNDAYNRLYEFMGQAEINRLMHAKGYAGTRIIHRLERPLSRDENAHTEAVRFVSGNTTLYSQPMLVTTPMEVKQKVLKGKGYMRRDSLVNEPFEFTYKNFYPLAAQQAVLKAVLFPQSVEPAQRFDITEEDRRFVMQYMSQLPTETTFPPYYADTAYYDASCKFLMFGSGRQPIPAGIRIFNKIGDAYGFLVDNAYIVDFNNGVEFMLSAVINTNTDDIYNDGKYAYKQLGFPFMKNLGEVIYDYERTRPRQHTPDLSEFRFKYDR
jgi:hypothetical protein